MENPRSQSPGMMKAGIIFFLCWLAGFVISYIRIYSRWNSPNNHLLVFFDNQIFFYPQTALPRSFDTLGSNNREVLSGWPAIISDILFWLVIGFAFAWLTRKLRPYLTIPLAVIAIFVTLLAVQAFLYLLGIEIEVVGP